MSQSIATMTETEFLAFVTRICEAGYSTEQEMNNAVIEFEILTEHPDGSDLIYYPKPTREDSPAGIIEEIKTWRRINGKPGFKQA